MNILEFSQHIKDEVSSITFLRSKNILKKCFYCCQNECSIIGDISLSDCQIFQCNHCCRRYSVRTDSMFAKSKLKLSVLLCILYFFCNCSPVSQCLTFLKLRVSKVSIIQWYNYFRDVMTTWLSQNPIQFNGTVNVLNVDETAIGGKCKYHRGRFTKLPRWLFGIVDKLTHKIHLEFVTKKDRTVIHPIIYRHVLRGSTINSDGAKVYKNLIHMGFQHNVVIHKT